MAELSFSLRLSSPAFTGSVEHGVKCVRSIQKEAGVEKEMTTKVPYYPADPGGLRVPSLRGILAFWYRSLQAGLSDRGVFDAQAQVFGSTARGQGLRMMPVGRPTFRSDKLEFRQPFQPFLYLGYGPIQILKPAGGGVRSRSVATSWNRSACRDAIRVPPDAERPELHFRALGTSDQIEALRRSLILLHLFGGVGSRSRRGWGSVEVVMQGLASPPDEGALVRWFAETLCSVWANLGRTPTKISSTPRFSAFSAVTEIRLTSVHGSYEEVLRDFYRRFQNVRLWRTGSGASQPAIAQNDHDLEAKDASARSVTGIPQRLAFGMPYQPVSRRGGWSIKYERAPGGEETRRASPLFLKVLRVGENRYAGVNLLLKARFFGTGSLQIGAESISGDQPFPGYGAVLTYLNDPGWTRVPVP